MPLAYDHTPSGLIVPAGSHEASVQAALKAHDPALMLDYAIDPAWGRQVWQVLRRVTSQGQVEVVCRWRDPVSGEPLPLSHGLVDHVRNLSIESRAPVVDHDAENDRLRERNAADAEAEIHEYTRTLVRRLRGIDSTVLPRGVYRRNTQFRNVTDVR